VSNSTMASNVSLAEQIAAHDLDNPFYSFEFFPPRTDQVCVYFTPVLFFSFMWDIRVLKTSYLVSPAYLL